MYDEHWRNAQCVDKTEIFYPEAKGGRAPKNQMFNSNAYKEAREICYTCPLIEECLKLAISFEGGAELRYGMWGGMTPRERKKYNATLNLSRSA